MLSMYPCVTLLCVCAGSLCCGMVHLKSQEEYATSELGLPWNLQSKSFLPSVIRAEGLGMRLVRSQMVLGCKGWSILVLQHGNPEGTLY